MFFLINIYHVVLSD